MHVKRRYTPFLVILTVCWNGLFMPSRPVHAQTQQTLEKAERLSKQLKLSILQEAQLVQVLDTESSKLQAVNSSPSLTDADRAEQLKGVYNETNSRVQTILTPKQYGKWQAIRQKELRESEKRIMS